MLRQLLRFCRVSDLQNAIVVFFSLEYSCPVVTTPTSVKVFASKDLQFVVCLHVCGNSFASAPDNEDFHVCPVCDVQFQNTDDLQLHVNTHFNDEQVANSSEYFCLFDFVLFLSSFIMF